MTDLVLRDIDPNLAERIRKVAQTNGWTVHQTIMHLIERGLYASEGGALRFDGAESDVMQSVIAALETVPNDPGFALIGRIEGASAATDASSPAYDAKSYDSRDFDPSELERFLENVPVGSKLGGRRE
jgi:hypothetical protein